jgi:transcription elongation factor Elf1
MVRTMFQQMLFRFTCKKCGHCEDIVICRLEGVSAWPCEACGDQTDVTKDPYKSEIATIKDTASEIDKQAQQRGQLIEWIED